MNPYLIVGFVLALIGSFYTGYWRGEVAGEATVQQKWDHEKADQLAAWAQQQDEARKREQTIQAQADHLRQEKDREIRNLNARSAGLIASLQQRPERTAEGSAASQAAGAGQGGPGCTGAELYRSHAEAFAREAARAEQLRAALKQCYAQYEAVSK